MTPDEFAKTIKVKYPQYANVDNLTLAKKMVEKYPQYASKVNFPKKTFLEKVGGVAKSIGNALTSSEQAAGNDTAAAIGGNTFANSVNKTNQSTSDADYHYLQTLIKGRQDAIANGTDTSHYDTALKNFQMSGQQSTSDLFPALNKTNAQVLGDFGGVALDVASAGSYGEAAKGAETGKLLTSGTNATARVFDQGAKDVLAGREVLGQAGKKTLGQTLKGIGIKTAQRAGLGAATGYGYDVTNNLQDGKTGGQAFKPGLGTILGGVVPTVIGGVQAGVAITKDNAPKFINSLIKPKAADFSYGKDPGRTVSELGITGNSLPDFEQNIAVHKADIGTRIGEVYSNPDNANIVINAEDELKKIDDAITEAAKGGKENQGIVTTLQNTKDALLYEHGVDANGNIVKIGTTPRDLSNLSPQEAFDLKKLVSSQTKFTGRPTDDKTVNSILKNIYGSLTEKLNSSVETNNPEIRDLNQKYADLTSAELAVKNRDAIVKRANIISSPVKFGGAAGIITAISTGGAAIPAILVGSGVAALDKAMESTAVKTRIAAWLGTQKPSAVNAIIAQNPGIRQVLYRVFPKIASQLGKN